MSTDPTGAAIDRIADGVATLLIDDNTQLDIDADLLPDGISEGDWITIDRSIDPPIIVADPERTTKQRQELSERVERLRQRSRRFQR